VERYFRRLHAVYFSFREAISGFPVPNGHHFRDSQVWHAQVRVGVEGSGTFVSSLIIHYYTSLLGVKGHSTLKIIDRGAQGVSPKNTHTGSSSVTGTSASFPRDSRDPCSLPRSCTCSLQARDRFCKAERKISRERGDIA